MSLSLSPDARHPMSIDWRYGNKPFLRPGEALASCSATVNGVAAASEVRGDETVWDVVVSPTAEPGTKLVSIVSIVTDSTPPRRDSRRVVHTVGIPDAKPI